jgi:DNA-binding transcriptional MerR regulator
MDISLDYSIGEFSKLTGTSIKTLRYYDEIGILIPVYKDEKSGFRYYSRIQYVYLDLINRLKDLNFSLKEIRSFLYEKSLDDIEDFFCSKKKEIDCQINKLKKNGKIVSNFLTYIYNLKDGKITDYQISVRNIPPRQIIFTRQLHFNKHKSDAFFKIYEKLKDMENDFESKGWYFSRLHNSLDTLDIENYKLDLCREITFCKNQPLEYTDIIPSGEYACIKLVGGSDEIFKNYEKLKKWTKDNKYKINGNPLIFYIYPIFTELMSSRVDQQIKEIQIKVDKIK